MDLGFLRRLPSPWQERRLRIFGVVLLVLLFLLALYVIEQLWLRHDQANIEQVLDQASARYLAAADREFNAVQRQTRRIATEVASQQMVQEYLNAPSNDPTSLFSLVSRFARDEDVGIEVYDDDATLVAWEGRSGPVHRREVHLALDGQMISYVNRTPLFAQLFVVTPVRREGRIIGAVLVRKTIDVDQPVNSRFMPEGGLTKRLQDQLGVTVNFVFSPNAEPSRDGRFVSSVLYGIDSTRIGVVSVQRPAASAYLESVEGRFETAFIALEGLLLALVAIAVWEISSRALPGAFLRGLVATLLIWGTRYAMLRLDFPSGILTSGIFDPALFASEFGEGVAKSIGEAALTVAALALNVIYIATLVLRRPETAAGEIAAAPRVPSSRGLIIARFVAALAIAALLLALLEAYGLAVRGAVFNSSLQFSDPAMMIPSFELGVMIFTMLIFSTTFLAVTAGGVWLMVVLLSPYGRRAPRPAGSWILALLVLYVGALAATLLNGQIPVSPLYLFMSSTGIWLVVLLLRIEWNSGRNVMSIRNALLSVIVAAVLLYPLLYANAHEKDRSRVEGYAQEVVRPADSWFTLVVDDGLQTMLSPETIRVLQEGDQDETYRLAFTCWVRSLAGREGYTSLFAVADTSGHDISRFMIGGQSATASQVDVATQLTATKTIRIKEVGTGVNALKLYTGTVPIVSSSGALLGYGRVIVAAGPQALFRGEGAASFIRAGGQEGMNSFYRPLTLAEFRDGMLISTTDPSLPVGYTLPTHIQRWFTDSSQTSLWSKETIDDRTYEIYYIRGGTDPRDIVSIGLPQYDTSWYITAVVRACVQCGLAAIICLVGFALVYWLRGKRYTMTFRDRLLIAMLVTALVPLALLTLYGRYYARERLMEQTAERLQRETLTVVQSVLDQMDDGPWRSLSPLATEQLASNIGVDFNVYEGYELKVSSRPELFEAGILDSRMSGAAYAAVLMHGKRFYVETESIGQYRYAVGYRPVVDATGTLVAAISVPTLYRQEELEAEVSARNAFVFGVYILVLLAMLVIAATLANRIASPIQRLTAATRRIAAGDLDVELHMPEAEGELGALVNSFEQMTRDLKRTREDLIRFERELAWKEMAQQVAHEIKNPLTPMRLSVQYLRQMYRDKAADFKAVLDEVTETLIRQIDTLSHIASEFSHFARMPKRVLEPCDVNAVLTEAAQLYEQEDKIVFVHHLAAGLPPLFADREELRRAFINIFRNSVQAMEGEGKITLTTWQEKMQIGIRIQDTGPGIPEEMHGRLFQPNFSTKTEGMGLGLAIVKKTVDDLSGRITIESTSGAGTTVTMMFPVAVEGATIET